MRRSVTLWVVALLITLASAVYQRVTGPTHPARGKVVVGGEQFRYRLLRSYAGGDAPVRIAVSSPEVEGTLRWKRNKTRDPWTEVPMKREGDALTAALPLQPPAGKLAYQILLRRGEESVMIGEPPVVIRFRGEVPGVVLALHVVFMFAAMLVSARAGLEYFRVAPDYRRLVPWVLVLLTVGGLILGPIVQKYAFGAYWTGWPLGGDLTDNKTAVAWLAWMAAWVKLWRRKDAGGWALVASLVTLAVFLIPHSLLGSELKYEELSAAP